MSEPEGLPTEEELQRLSLRAIVAYAARCARRVQPLYRSAKQEHVEAVDRAIRLAEQYAGGTDDDAARAAAACASAASAACAAADAHAAEPSAHAAEAEGIEPAEVAEAVEPVEAVEPKEPEKPKPPDKKPPTIKLTPLPVAQRPPKKAEPVPQKPVIKLPVEAIRASKAGTKPLSEHLRKHEQRKKRAARKTAREKPPPETPAGLPVPVRKHEQGKKLAARKTAREKPPPETPAGLPVPGREQGRRLGWAAPAARHVDAPAHSSHAGAAAARAAQAAHASRVAGAARATAAAWADYEELVKLSKKPGSVLGNPIDFGNLGPLWPEGEREWFRETQRQTSPATAKRIEICIDPGDASKETIQAVLDAISDLHVAAGGLGIEFEIDGHLVLARGQVTS